MKVGRNSTTEKSGKFYPDFVAVTKSGNIVALEWKGEDRINNDDTKYKVEIAKIWEQLGKGKLVTFPYSDFSKYGCSFPADAP